VTRKRRHGGTPIGITFSRVGNKATARRDTYWHYLLPCPEQSDGTAGHRPAGVTFSRDGNKATARRDTDRPALPSPVSGTKRRHGGTPTNVTLLPYREQSDGTAETYQRYLILVELVVITLLLHWIKISPHCTNNRADFSNR